ncbi:hypothetical protein O6H91_01G005000 [Diphasiastrum complanatum]|nr:hypothetical protein O6H91_01G005000 [Diphasiastrum complanatum]
MAIDLQKQKAAGNEKGAQQQLLHRKRKATEIEQSEYGKDESQGLIQAKKYIRGDKVSVKGIVDKKLKGQLRTKERLFVESALNAAKVEQWLLPSEGGYLEPDGIEKTWNLTQESIVREVDISSSKKSFDLKLPDLGPYAIDFTSSGRFLLLGGRKGHLAILDWKEARLLTEIQVRETTRDVKFLHNELFFAAAQKKYVYIYDKKGVEIHCLKSHLCPLKLEYLPHHFLLTTIDKAGILRYQDTSTGHMVVQHRTRLGRCGVMRVNPYNAVMGLGHSNGTVTMWSPNMDTPLMSLLCHRGPLTALAFDAGGQQMVTAGTDGKVKVFDVRKLQPLHSYFSPTVARSVEISQKGLLAVASGSGIEIWKDALVTKQPKPYMKHRLLQGSQVQDICYCPYEDVLGIGHEQGFSSILVPGSGEPNYDTFVANPYETRKQRREAEVHALLNKLQPEMIVLDPDRIGTIQRSAIENKREKQIVAKEANLAGAIASGKPVPLKKKTKGRNKSSKRHKKKQDNIISERRAVIKQQVNSGANFVELKTPKAQEEALPRALARFSSK